MKNDEEAPQDLKNAIHTVSVSGTSDPSEVSEITETVEKNHEIQETGENGTANSTAVEVSEISKSTPEISVKDMETKEAEAAQESEISSEKTEAENSATPQPEETQAESEGSRKENNQSSASKRSLSQMISDGFTPILIVTYGICVWGYALNLGIQIFFNKLCTYYQLTPTHFIFKNGFFITEVRKIAIWDIAQVNVTRNIWQRLLGVGTIELRIRDHGLTGDSSDPSLEGIDSDSSTADNILFLPGIKDPENVKDLINNYRLFIRRRMGRRFLNKITQ